MDKVKTDGLQKSVFKYLNELRASGQTNMLGGTRFIMDEFGIKRDQARDLLVLWTYNYNDDGNYDTIKFNDRFHDKRLIIKNDTKNGTGI